MKSESYYDVVLVGGGVAGLTSAAYLSKRGYSVLLCEKESKLGGLVGSFDHKGFRFDSGARALENSGILFPMLNQLGIDIEFVKNHISIGIEDKTVEIRSEESLLDYQEFLSSIFPQNRDDIHSIIGEIKSVMGYMDVLYGIDNPLFLDFYKDREYIFKTLIPWALKYQLNIRKVINLNESINTYLLKFTDNQSLIDMITQHFFKDTPTFFALSYFGVYLDYYYPLRGTCVLVDKLSKYIVDSGGDIVTDTEIIEVNVEDNIVVTKDKKSYKYAKMIWAADSSRLYNIVRYDSVDLKIKREIEDQRHRVESSHGGDSILTIYLGVDMDKSYFKDRKCEHLFYTPKSNGLSSVSLQDWDKFNIEGGLKEKILSYLEYTTYEISCPVLRDENLAPDKKTGLIVSTLLDYRLVKEIDSRGWYGELKELCKDKIIEVLDNSLFEGLKENVIFSICSTPLTIEKVTASFEGAITGWAFDSEEMPAETRLKKINRSVLTPIPHIYQAGQWTFSPSGVPISILTGKMAADRVDKALKNKKKKDR